MSRPSKAERIKYGSANVVVYEFAEPLDTLPMHRHLKDESTNHISIVTKGSFLVKGSGWQIEVGPGEIVAFEPEQWHEFVALEKNSKLTNVQTGRIGTIVRHQIGDEPMEIPIALSKS